MAKEVLKATTEYDKESEEFKVIVEAFGNTIEDSIQGHKLVDQFIIDAACYGISYRLKQAIRAMKTGVKTSKTPEQRLEEILAGMKEGHLLLRAGNSEQKTTLSKSEVAYMQVTGRDPANLEDISEVKEYLKSLPKEDRTKLLSGKDVKIQMAKNKVAELEQEEELEDQ